MGHYLSEVESDDEYQKRMKLQAKRIKEIAAARGWGVCSCGTALNPGIPHGHTSSGRRLLPRNRA